MSDPGDIWVSGPTLHVVDADGTERSYEGEALGRSYDRPGDLWVQDGDLRYVDQYGVDRRLPTEVGDPVPGRPGSIWVESSGLAVVDGEQRERTVIGLATDEESAIDEEEQTDELAFEDSEVDFVFDELDVSPQVLTEGDSFEISLRATNEGGSGNEAMRLYVYDQEADAPSDDPVFVVKGDAQAEKSSQFDLDPDDEESKTYTYETGSEDVGALTVRAEFQVSEAVIEAPVYVEEEFDGLVRSYPFDVHPSSLSVEPDEVEPGETVGISASIENREGEGTEAFLTWVGDELVDVRLFEVSESWSVDDDKDFLRYDTTLDDLGQQQVTLECHRSRTEASSDLYVSDICFERDADGPFLYDVSVADGPLRVGESSTIEVTLIHCGSDPVLPGFDIYLDDRRIGGAPVALDTRREEKTSNTDVVPRAGEYDASTIRVVGPSGDEIERDVEVAPAPFGVEIKQAPESTEGTVAVTAAVTNEGAGRDRQAVELRVDGEVFDSTEVTVQAGESETIGLFADPAPGEHTLTVASRTDEASTATTVYGTGGPDATLGDVPALVMPGAETVEVPVVIRNEGLSTTAEVVATVEGVTATETVSVPAGDEVTVAPSVAVDLDPSTSVSVEATVTADGEEILAAAETVTVASAEADCVEVQNQQPCDLNGDGLYRDVTGDGTVGQTDAVLFFERQHREAWKRPELFDFTGNGTVTHGDVIELFEYVATGGN